MPSDLFKLSVIKMVKEMPSEQLVRQFGQYKLILEAMTYEMQDRGIIPKTRKKEEVK